MAFRMQRRLAPNGARSLLFVDHSQVVQLECLRHGICGTKSLWGRVVTDAGG
jgi:phosphosulfolactate synthase (CoM biosynthesis protein A)